MAKFKWFHIVLITLTVNALFPQGGKADLAYSVQAKSQNVILYQANTDKKIIALTFDDGPDDKYTPQILNVLKKHNVKATFFLLGTRVHKYPNIAKQILQEGHAIGNHTYWHPELTKMNVDSMLWEIEQNEKELQNILQIKTNLFRAPYGALTEVQIQKLHELGYRVVGWSIDTEDWRNLPASEIKQKILNQLHPGAIVLMHSAGHWTQDLSGTVEALDEIIPMLKKEGYLFVTIPEMFNDDILK